MSTRSIDVICSNCGNIYRNRLVGLDADECPKCGCSSWVSLQHTDETPSVDSMIAAICRKVAAERASRHARFDKLTESKRWQSLLIVLEEALNQERAIIAKKLREVFVESDEWKKGE